MSGFRVETIESPTAVTMVLPEGTSDLLELPREDWWELFTRAGMLLFRGFEVGPSAMLRFAEAHGSQPVSLVSVQFEDTPEGPAARLCPNPKTPYHYHDGMHNVDYHRENSFRCREQPELMLFNCVRPAKRGGHTTLCDGARVWQELQPATRRYFEEHRVTGHWYRIGTSEAMDDLAGMGAEGSDSPLDYLANYLEGSFGAHLERWNQRCPGLDAEFDYARNEDGTIHTRLTCKAVAGTLYDPRPVFCNSVTTYGSVGRLSRQARPAGAPSPIGAGLPAMDCTRHDGAALPDEVFRDVDAVQGRVGVPLLWKAGDLALIDNSRFMHGRTGFRDAERALYVHGCMGPET